MPELAHCGTHALAHHVDLDGSLRAQAEPKVERCVSCDLPRDRRRPLEQPQRFPDGALVHDCSVSNASTFASVGSGSLCSTRVVVRCTWRFTMPRSSMYFARSSTASSAHFSTVDAVQVITRS